MRLRRTGEPHLELGSGVHVTVGQERRLRGSFERLGTLYSVHGGHGWSEGLIL